MSTYYMDNYTTAEVTKPSGKYPKGEMKGKKRVIIDRFTLKESATAGLNASDVIYGPVMPADSIITNVTAHISKSLGATGIFSVGTADDADRYIKSVDGGGQAASAEMKDDATQDGMYERILVDTQIVITCTEVMDDSVMDGVLTLEVEYVND